MRNIYWVLLSLTLFVAVVTSQSLQACLEARRELADNEPCLNAIIGIRDFNVTRGELNTYCSSTCRDLNLRIATNCLDEVSKLFVCISKLCIYVRSYVIVAEIASTNTSYIRMFSCGKTTFISVAC